MIRLHPARRAERFDSLVEGARRDSVDPRTSDLLELVGALRTIPEPVARPAFVADLREQLMVAARTELSPAGASVRDVGRDDVDSRLTVSPRARTRRENRVGVALGAIAIVGATSSMAVASQSAIPGDVLYPMKRAIENTQAGFSVGDDAKGTTILHSASDRLDEVHALTRKDEPDARLVQATLNTFADQATEASDLLMSDYEQTGHADSIAELRDFTALSMDTLGSLEEAIPAAAEDALLNAAHVLFTIDAAANQVCPECGGEGVSEIPPALVASGTDELDEAVTALGAFPTPDEADGAGSGEAQLQDGKDVKGGDPSAVDAPADPVTIPSLPEQPEASTGGLEDLVPTNGVSTGNGDGNGGKTKKHKPPAVDLSPVTGVVNDVVSGVVDGVNDVLDGLTGQTGP